MKRSPRFSKTPVSLSDSVQQRLSAYALAVTAAGAGIASPSAEAKIVYTPTHHILTKGMLPIPVAGTNAFNLNDKYYIITGSWTSQILDIYASANAAVVGAKSSASALRRGQVIGPKDSFQAAKALMAGAFRETQISQTTVFGPFANTTHRFLGLKFKLHGKVHYGWARFSAVTASDNPPAVTATLTGYAYETIPNKPIIAGKTKGEDVVYAGPASLGALAAGSTAIHTWRPK